MLRSELAAKEAELQALLKKSPKQLWMDDLDAFEEGLQAWEDQLQAEANADPKAKGGKAKPPAKGGKAKAAAKAALGSDDDFDDDDFEEEASDEEYGAKKKKKAPPKKGAAAAAPAPSYGAISALVASAVPVAVPEYVAPKRRVAKVEAEDGDEGEPSSTSSSPTAAAAAAASKPKAAPRPRAAAAKKVVKDESASEEEMSDDDDDDDDVRRSPLPLPPPARPQSTSKPSAPSPKPPALSPKPQHQPSAPIVRRSNPDRHLPRRRLRSRWSVPCRGARPRPRQRRRRSSTPSRMARMHRGATRRR